MQISEETASALAALLVAIGFGAKETIRRLRPTIDEEEKRAVALEERRAAAAVLGSMRNEISRLTDLVASLSLRLDEEVERRLRLEVENGKLKGEVERLSVRLSVLIKGD